MNILPYQNLEKHDGSILFGVWEAEAWLVNDTKCIK